MIFKVKHIRKPCANILPTSEVSIKFTIQKLFNSFICLLFFCTNISLAADEPSYAKYQNYLAEIRQSFEEQMMRESYLECNGRGGTFNQTIEELTMKFSTHRRATIEEARALCISVINRFVKAVNDHDNIQPYLKNHPFTFKNVSISIGFYGPQGHYYDGSVIRIHKVSDLANAREDKNRIIYYSSDPFTEETIELYSEPYDTALDRAENTPLKFPYAHTTTEFEAAFDQIFTFYTDEMEQGHGLNCSSIGGKFSNGIEEIGANFKVYHPVNVEEARSLLLIAANRLLHLINSNEKLKPYLLEKPFGIDRLKMQIGFRDKYSFNYHDGSLDKVILEGKEIAYYREETSHDSSSPLIEKETYQEAMKSLQLHK